MPMTLLLLWAFTYLWSNDLVSSCPGGQAHIEACVAAIDGGALFALAPVSFSLSKGGDKVEDKESKTVIAGNVAGSRGGGIATWAPLSVGFGYHLVCTLAQAIRVLWA
jgi:hypothetical protein